MDLRRAEKVYSVGETIPPTVTTDTTTPTHSQTSRFYLSRTMSVLSLVTLIVLGLTAASPVKKWYPESVGAK